MQHLAEVQSRLCGALEALQAALGDAEAAEGRAVAVGKVRQTREWGGLGWRGGGVQPGWRELG